MGVHGLWSILEPVKAHVPLHSLGGKTLAVDLSIWACEAQTVKKMVGVVTKPHLRNLFFRVSSLSLMGVKLVFVSEGEAPKLKAQTMNKRNEMRYGPSTSSVPSRPGRSYFNTVLKECLRLLDCLGVPWVQAAGEAEAMCAYLDANGYVDGCITNDGDVFLYGAKTVYRNFTMNVKDPHVDCYEVSSIQTKLGLNRHSLVGLAVFLGCDYIPKGVPGVGKEQVLKLIEMLKGESILQRFHQWKKEFADPTTLPKSTKKVVHCSVCCHPGSAKDHERNGCRLCGSDRYCEPHDYDYCCPCNWHKAQREKRDNAVEYNIKMKAKKCEGFPFYEVIDEFLRNKNKLIKVIKWVRPNLLHFQNFTLERMEWPKHYSCEKLLVLLTYYDMNERKLGREHATQLQAIRIVKNRIKNGIPCFEIEWVKPDDYVFPDDHPSDLPLVTIEEGSLFQAAYPAIVDLYQKEKAEEEIKKQKSKKTKPRTKPISDLDDVALMLSEMDLKPSSNDATPPDSAVDAAEILNCENNVLKFTLRSSDLPIVEDPLVNMIVLIDSETESEVFTPHIDNGKILGDACCSPAQCSSPPITAQSPNVSSVISELQLSGIDWDATSFVESPQTVARTAGVDCSKQNKHDSLDDNQSTNNIKMVGLNVNGTIKEMPASTGVDSKFVTSSKEDSKLEYQTLSLKERILLKNAYQCGVPYPQTHIDKVYSLAPLSLHKRESLDLSSKKAGLPLADECAKENRKVHELHAETTSVKKEKVISIIPIVGSITKAQPLELSNAKPCNFVSDVKKTASVPVKKAYTFVKDPKKMPIVPMRALSAGNISTKPTSQTAAKVSVKKTVCQKTVSSSEDSEAEEKPWWKLTKNKISSALNKDIPKDKSDKLKIQPAVNKQDVAMKMHTNTNTHHNYNTELLLSPPGSKTPSTETPGDDSDGDDSLISVDSPLPLSERLKLRSMQNI
ncbi:flap endonuclease GEN homolog 1 [Pelobates fuscus]|uniref:flap endonuclease GEN homolog 1 n=1 Tax=Pelobates fuscus TaxID=191477 RepID=UPI002FE4D89B